MKKGRKIKALALAGLAAVFLTACGSESEEASQTVKKEWAYVPEFIELDDENASYYNMKIFGDAAYYTKWNYDEATGESGTALVKMSLADGSKSEVNIPLEESTYDEATGSSKGQNLGQFTVLEDGSMVVTLDSYESTPTGDYKSWVTLAKFDADGNEIFKQDLRDAVEGEENLYARTLLVDGEGRIYLPSDSKVFLFDAEGNYRGVAQAGADNWINCIGVASNGKVYTGYHSYDGTGSSYVLNEVDFDNKTLTGDYKNFPAGNSEALAAGLEQELLATDGNKVYEYDLETQTAKEVFDWLDSDINGSFVTDMGALPDGRLYAVINDWGTDENNIALLTKTPYSELPEKEQIVLGVIGISSDLQAAAVKFNRSSDKYHVSLKQYMDSSNWTPEGRAAAITNLNNDLMSKHGPDIIDLSGVNISQLASKGVFEDLAPFLEKSETLNREDFMQSVLEACTYDGKLISVPKTFMMQTIVGHSSEVGTEPGWTIEELIAYADAHPEAALFDGMTQTRMLEDLMKFNGDSFIDWEKGTCNFDTPEFRGILELVSRFPKEYNWREEEASTPTKIQNGDVLLNPFYISDFSQLQEYTEMFEGEVTFIGFPTMDGSAGCALQMYDAYAINAKSKHQEAAWSFIESCLNTERGQFSWGFPSKSAELDKLAKETLEVEYIKDENGNLIKDENGDPIPSMGSSAVSYEDGWTYEYRIPTQEEVDKILELVELARPVSEGNEEIIKIISEEAAGFFEGQKSIDEVVGIIQSRAKIYVSENS